MTLLQSPQGLQIDDHTSQLNVSFICNQYIFLPYQRCQITTVPTYSMMWPFRGHLSLKSSSKYSDYYVRGAYLLLFWNKSLNIMRLLEIGILL